MHNYVSKKLHRKPKRELIRKRKFNEDLSGELMNCGRTHCQAAIELKYLTKFNRYLNSNEETTDHRIPELKIEELKTLTQYANDDKELLEDYLLSSVMEKLEIHCKKYLDFPECLSSIGMHIIKNPNKPPKNKDRLFFNGDFQYY